MNPTTSGHLPRRIDTIVRRETYTQYCARRRLEMVKLFCAGLSIKRIAQKFDTSPVNVCYAISKFMRDRKLHTHAQLGVWFAQNEIASSNKSPKTPMAVQENIGV